MDFSGLIGWLSAQAAICIFAERLGPGSVGLGLIPALQLLVQKLFIKFGLGLDFGSAFTMRSHCFTCSCLHFEAHVLKTSALCLKLITFY